MAKYITKKEAITKCKAMWKLVLDGKAKNKWEAFDIIRKTDPNFIHSCYLCAYDAQNHVLDQCCTHCPLVVQLGKRCKDPGTDYTCNPKKFAALVMKLKEK
jgi:hypothetical protein